jgi:hypothetical protein
MIWIQAIAAAVVCCAILIDVADRKTRKASMCDTCKLLIRKNRRSMYDYRYECGCSRINCNCFDKQPEYCAYYEPREKGE